MSIDILTKYGRDLWGKGASLIAGVDEVGRGALAGPMVVSAVILNPKHLEEYKRLKGDLEFYQEIKDSKLLTAKKRSYINEYLINEVIDYSIVEIDNRQIDQLGMSKCTQIGFYQAIKKLKTKPDHIFTDTFEIKGIVEHAQTNIRRGDNKSITVAAASIMAKVYRDQLMTEHHHKSKKYQVYCFDQHKGYGTSLHRELIKKHGYSDLHRLTFNVK